MTVCLALALAALAAGCGTDDGPTAVDAKPIGSAATTDGSAASAGSTGDFTIDWGKKNGGVQSGTIEVPVDYHDPSQGTFTLPVVRHLATNPDERIGTLLVNPGGPGFGGTVLAENASAIYGKDLIERFDILAWDPRGTGGSDPAIDCFDDYDHFFDNGDITPDDAAEQQQNVDLAEEAADDCSSKNAAIIQHVGTNDTARDMDAIRQALGEDKISYFGFSYGSELGATWATMFPDTVRAAVLDGAADPNEDLDEGNLSQMKGFEASLDTFLAQCSAQASCKFHNGGDAEGAFDALMEKMDENPLPALDGRPKLTRGAALSGVIEAMYSDQSWPQLAEALNDAQQGDGSGLMQLYDAYYQRQANGSYDNSLEAFNVISCMDVTDRPTVAEEDAFAAQITAVAPRLSPGTAGGYFCTFYPQTDDPRVAITGAGAGPIVVVGTTGDPSTPLESSRAMARALQQGSLVIVHADQHTGYGVNDCVDEAVDGYLIDPTNVPEDGLECK